MKCKFCGRRYEHNAVYPFCNENCRTANKAFQKLTGKELIDESSFDEDPEVALQTRDDAAAAAASESRDERIARLKAQRTELLKNHDHILNHFIAGGHAEADNRRPMLNASHESIEVNARELLIAIAGDDLEFVREYSYLFNSI